MKKLRRRQAIRKKLGVSPQSMGSDFSGVINGKGWRNHSGSDGKSKPEPLPGRALSTPNPKITALAVQRVQTTNRNLRSLRPKRRLLLIMPTWRSVRAVDNFVD